MSEGRKYNTSSVRKANTKYLMTKAAKPPKPRTVKTQEGREVQVKPMTAEQTTIGEQT